MGTHRWTREMGLSLQIRACDNKQRSHEYAHTSRHHPVSDICNMNKLLSFADKLARAIFSYFLITLLFFRSHLYIFCARLAWPLARQKHNGPARFLRRRSSAIEHFQATLSFSRNSSFQISQFSNLSHAHLLETWDFLFGDSFNGIWEAQTIQPRWVFRRLLNCIWPQGQRRIGWKW